jgi:hypothetical protein
MGNANPAENEQKSAPSTGRLGNSARDDQSTEDEFEAECNDLQSKQQKAAQSKMDKNQIVRNERGLGIEDEKAQEYDEQQADLFEKV